MSKKKLVKLVAASTLMGMAMGLVAPTPLTAAVAGCLMGTGVIVLWLPWGN